jgi:hypothetical protein
MHLAEVTLSKLRLAGNLVFHFILKKNQSIKDFNYYFINFTVDLFHR